MAKYYLMPVEDQQHQKGFGHNAVVEARKDGTPVPLSYLRKIAKIIPGKPNEKDGLLTRLCGHNKEMYNGKMKSLNDSPTVMRHLVAFCIHNGLPAITKRDWNKMPRVRD